MDWAEFSKLFIATLIGTIIPRIFKRADKQQDQNVRIAVMGENLRILIEDTAIQKRDIRALWRELDKLKGKT